MRQIALLLLLVFSLGCDERNPEIKSKTESDVPSAHVSIDTADGQKFCVVIQEGKTIVPISESEMHLVDSLLKQQIEEHNRKSDKTFSIDLSKYRRQYFPSIDTNGDKRVEVNCFCQVHNDDNWKKQRVQVHDGGKCYFNIKVDLTTLTVVNFHINGQA
jgi:hypothetical protein